jgi:hypothetical protein
VRILPKFDEFSRTFKTHHGIIISSPNTQGNEMNAQDQNKVLEIIGRVVPEVGTVSWRSIIAAVCSEATVTNAMDVRGVLQYMLNKR